MNGFVFAGAALVVRFGLKIRDWLGLVLASALVGWVFIIVGLEALGVVGQLRLVPAVGLAIAGFVTGVGVWWRAGETADGIGTHLEVPLPVPPPSRLNRAATWLVVTLAVWSVANTLISGLCNPVLVVSDAPIYHLYFAVRWWKAGTLELVAAPFGESAACYFPANGDVWFTWLLLPRSAEQWAKVGQWPFLLLGMTAVYALARELCGRRSVALFPAALWGTGTLPLLQAIVSDVDLVLAAWYLVATLFLVRYARSHRMADLACFALATGATLGTKYVALLYVPWLLIAASVIIVRHSPAAKGLAGTARQFLVLVLGVALPCAYWYARNWALTGNPLYPLHGQVFGVPVLRGWYTRETLLTHPEYHIPIERIGYLAQTMLRGADPILLPVWLSGVAGAIWSALRSRRLPILLIVLAGLHVVLFWWVNPYQREDRFLFAAFGLLAVPVAVVLDRWPGCCVIVSLLIGWHLVVGQLNLTVSPEPPALLAPLHLSGLLQFELTPVAAGRIVLLCSLGASAAMAGAAVRPAPWCAGWVRRLGVAGLAIGVAGLGVEMRVQRGKIDDRSLRIQSAKLDYRSLRFYPIWDFLNGWLNLEAASGQPDAGRGARVAYAGTNLPYYLFGVGLRNDVSYVNINEHREFLMHDYHAWYARRGDALATTPTPDWDRREADEEAWLRNLRDQGIDLLFIGRTNRAGGLHNFYDRDGFPIERTWADRHPDIFRLLHADGMTRLYRLERSSQGTEAPPQSPRGRGEAAAAEKTCRGLDVRRKQLTLVQ